MMKQLMTIALYSGMDFHFRFLFLCCPSAAAAFVSNCVHFSISGITSKYHNDEILLLLATRSVRNRIMWKPWRFRPTHYDHDDDDDDDGDNKCSWCLDRLACNFP